MQSNKLRLAIRATAAAAIFGVAGQAGAVNFTAGDYEMAVYGYARLNASYDIDENVSTSTQSMNYSAINVGAAEDNEATGYFDADAVQSRIGVRATSPEGVMVNIEGDFRPGTIRLRHAYGSYNGVLAGQTWSNYTSFVGNTSTLDFDSLPGLAGYQSRVAQLRYTTGPLSIAAEDPKNSIDGAGTATKDGMPALTARIQDSAGGLSYAAAVLAQQVGYDTGTADDSSFGFGAFVAGKMAVTDMITIQGTLSYSDGANSYLYRSGADSAYVDANGDVETISGYGGSVGAGISLGNGRSINIGYGTVMVDLDDAVADSVGTIDGNTTESVSAVMANYQWTPVKNVMMGVEYKYGMRETQNGDDGDASSLAFAAQYNF
ncbi:DcaP family trimeric outer membrane transporter [Marinobacter sp. MA]|uniref:DcaP family trimeric outer membrane transporter n=1 Tax=Marinobacter sp. MA TaxID=2971606 RepID=UPI003AAE1745